MVDIHSHFLFGIDDGSKNISQTIKMLEQAEESGISDLVATPHVNETIDDNYLSQINKTFLKVENIIKQKNLKLRIHQAAEIILDFKIKHWTNNSGLLLGKNKKYILFELPLFVDFEKVSQIIFDLLIENITPILAHPERNIKIQAEPKILIKWLNQGCLMQMNAGSITGQFGKKCRDLSDRILKSGIIQICASDAHEPKYRNYAVLRKAYQIVCKQFDSIYADVLFVNNPQKILYGGNVQKFEIQEENLEKSGLDWILNILKLKRQKIKN